MATDQIAEMRLPSNDSLKLNDKAKWNKCSGFEKQLLYVDH